MGERRIEEGGRGGEGGEDEAEPEEKKERCGGGERCVRW